MRVGPAASNHPTSHRRSVSGRAKNESGPTAAAHAATPRHGSGRRTAHPVQATKGAVDEREARLRLLCRALGKTKMPSRVLPPRMRLQERVLLTRARLTSCQRERSTYWRTSINRFACLTASSFNL
jgi:hypothetical protein